MTFYINKCKCMQGSNLSRCKCCYFGPPLFNFPTVIFIVYSTGTRGQETTTESYSHSSYFNNLTVIKDNSSGNCRTKNSPTLRSGEQTFQTRPPKLQMNPKNSLRNFSGFLLCGFFPWPHQEMETITRLAPQSACISKNLP